MALDAGGTTLKSALFETGQILADSLATEPVDSSGSAEDIRTAFRNVLTRQKDGADGHGGTIVSVCMDTPGPFDYAAGIPRMTHKYLSIRGQSLVPWFREVLGRIPVRFLHDSHAFLLGVAPECPGVTNLAGVMIGTGLGFAVQVEGIVQRNESGGPRYSLFQAPFRGKTLEDFVSARGVVDAYNTRAGGNATDAKAVAEWAKTGDPAARRAFLDMGSALAEGIAPLLDRLRIEALILGGQVSRSFDLFGDSLAAGLARVRSLQTIRASKRIDLAHLLGAARYGTRG